MPIGEYGSIEGMPSKIIIVDQSKAEINNISTFIGLESILQKYYLQEYSKGEQEQEINIFKEKCCECKGKGYIKIDMEFLPPSYLSCAVCDGKGYTNDLINCKVKGYSYPELYQKSFKEIYDIYQDDENIRNILTNVIDIGLGYLILGQLPKTLSSGEAQRLKLVKAINKKKSGDTLYIIDEPTVGLHCEDISKLLKILKRLVENGNSIWIIEHQIDMLLSCSYLIELGPKGGDLGGNVIAKGTPLEISALNTPTGLALKNIIK